MRWVLALLIASGCGRIGFDVAGGDVTGDGGTGDGMQPGQQSDAGPVVGSPSFVTAVEGSSASASALNVDVPGGVQNGDVIIVMIGWRSGTNGVINVVDNNGNTYASQGAVTRSNNMVSQQTFTVTSAGVLANPRITVTMTTPAPSLSVRVLVYRNVMVIGGGSAQGTTANATTPVSPFTAGSIVVGSNTATVMAASPCAQCTTRMTTAFGDMVVERVFPTAGGIQSISVMLDGSAAWVMGQVELDPQ